jgi:ParB family chromosome partitioning protein
MADGVARGLLPWDDLERWQASRRHVLAWMREQALKPDLDGVKGSTSVEWYTPAEYIDAAREVLGGTIDVDPASSDLANQTVRAINYHTEHDDGLTQEWPGTVWLNPPYGKGTGQFVAKLVEEIAAGRTTAAVLLINAYGFDAGWWRPLWEHTICFTDHRITFTSPQRGTGGPANGNVFVYIGPHPDWFAVRFDEFGVIVRRWP